MATDHAVSGDITLYLDALDQPWEHPAAQAVVRRLGQPSTSDTHEDGVPVRTVRFDETGVRMQWRRDRLASVVFTVHDGRSALPGGGSVEPALRGPRPPYPWIDSLLDGMTRHSTREELRALLGEPLRSWYAYDQFLVEGRVVSGTFHGDDFKEFTLLAEDPIVLSHGMAWAPIVVRRDGRLLLEVPVSMGITDTTFRFEITEHQLEVLTQEDRYTELARRIQDTSDRGKIKKAIKDVCSGG